MALPAATFDGQKLTTVVSRFFGLANDTNGRAAVLDHINIGLWEISLNTPWDWLSTTAADITVVSGTAAYNLVSATASGVHDEIYDVRLVGDNERTLFPLTRRDYDTFVQGEQSSTGVPTHYFVFAQQNEGVITLVPTPAVGDTLRIRYTRVQPTISDATASSLAMPNKYVPLVIYKGAELVAAWKDPERQALWREKYTSTLRRALDVDRNKPDNPPSFTPQIAQGGARTDFVNPDDLSWYPRG